MKDPGYISESAWNQETPYRDADWCDIEQDERWDHVTGSDFSPTSPDRVRTRGVGPGSTVRRAANASLSTPVPPAGVLNLS